MPEKVRVSPAGQAPLSTGPRGDRCQAALVLLELPDDDPPDDDPPEEDPPDELAEEDDPLLPDDPFDDPESDEDEEPDSLFEPDSLLAGIVLVPVERLSFR
jgi:hypothetical protein